MMSKLRPWGKNVLAWIENYRINVTNTQALFHKHLRPTLNHIKKTFPNSDHVNRS